MTQRGEHRRFGAPDEVRAFPNGKAEGDAPVVTVDGFGASTDAK
jgi:hypothetical protein